MNWAFKLYDVNNDGMIDLREMSVIIEMMDDLDGVKPGEIRYDANGNPEPLPTAKERAESLFSALDKDNDGCLTKREFITGYTKRSHLLRKQDADDQKRKLNCLILLGPLLNNKPLETDSCSQFLSTLISIRTGVSLEKEDLAFSEIRRVGEEKRSAFIRFVSLDKRMEVWCKKSVAKKNNLYMEEWLTGYRDKLLTKCRQLKKVILASDWLTQNNTGF